MRFDDITTMVFDFDGTLATCPYDFKHMRRSVLRIAEEFELAPAQLDGFGLLEMIAEGAELLDGDPARAEAFRATALEQLGAIEYEAAATTRLLPGVVDALVGLRAVGFRMGIVTRNSTAAVRRILGDIALPVETILCREDVARPKPHIDHVRQALHLLGEIPVRALMVGDHPTDIQMGKAIGMATVAVATGQSSEEDLRAAAPDALLPSVLSLAALLLAARLERGAAAQEQSALTPPSAGRAR